MNLILCIQSQQGVRVKNVHLMVV